MDKKTKDQYMNKMLKFLFDCPDSRVKIQILRDFSFIGIDVWSIERKAKEMVIDYLDKILSRIEVTK